jgi:hypothetical protein
MRQILRSFGALVCSVFLSQMTFADNQTPTVSLVYPEDSLPFTLKLETANFTLPNGLQAYASAIYKGKWIFVAGRTNGLHGFDNVANNFSPIFQNTTVYVVDPDSKKTQGRSLIGSGLSQSQIDNLSVVAPEFFQKKGTLYVVGGYGVDTATGQMGTKPTLTALDLEKLVQWVEHGRPSIKSAVRQISRPIFQVTGGALFQKDDKSPFLLILGQNFSGFYRGSSNGIYTEQIRTFYLKDDGEHMSVSHDKISPITYPDYRRRDLNVVPILHNKKSAYVAFAGVFTLTNGVWTVPITIFPDGSSVEPAPSDPSTFKQAMNQYNCAAFGLYSKCSNNMYVVFPGGMSYGFFSGGVFTTNAEVPFINQITTIKIDKDNVFTQYLMNNEYPYIISPDVNPGNQLLFGSGAVFFPKEDIPLFKNGVIQLDKLPKKKIVIGHIVGGIMSTLPNTSSEADSTASPYIFKVILVPKQQ